jgi:ABC-type bacteriocin/lantibiotic exporter with double-glycine peptidase domain
MKKIKVVSQFLKTECGLCCAAMISQYYGRSVSLEELRDYQQPGRDGISGKQLSTLLEWLGFDCKIYRCKREHLPAIPLPAIAFWEGSHYVVIEKTKGSRVYIVDPGAGRVIVSLEEFDQLFSGLIFCPKPSERFEKRAPGRSLWWNYTFLLAKNKLLIASVLLLSLLAYVISTVVPMLVQKIIDAPTTEMNPLILIGGAALLGYAIAYTVSTLFSVVVKSRIYKSFFSLAMEKLGKSDFRYFLMRPLGVISYNLDCIDTINDSYSVLMVNSLISGGAVVILSIFFAVSSLRLFWVMALLLLLSFIVLRLSNNRVVRLNQSEISSRSRLKGKQFEFLSSICELKAYGREDTFYSEWEKSFADSVKKNLQKSRSEAFYNSLTAVLTLVLPLVILLAAFYMVSADRITMGTAISLYSLSTIVSSFAMNLFSSVNSFRTMGNLTDRVKDIVFHPEEKSGDKKPEDISKIQLDHVSFRYDKHAPLVLKDVSMTIEKGKKIAIIGGSGSGKSSIAKLLIKMYAPAEGKILFDGTDSESMDNKALRHIFGYVGQDGTLLGRSILDNLVMLAEDYTQDQVDEVCKITRIYDDIMGLPMKAATMVAEKGSVFSGGQKQRIILARALMSKPKILLLDEATSALDSITEHQIFDELNKLGLTLVVIAHRLSTVADADHIYVMKDGRVVEEGTHDALMQKGGEYFALYQCGANE